MVFDEDRVSLRAHLHELDCVTGGAALSDESDDGDFACRIERPGWLPTEFAPERRPPR